MTKSEKERIDKMSYIEMLTLWRFSPIGEDGSYFADEQGQYFQKVMAAKKSILSHYDQINASKLVGW